MTRTTNRNGEPCWTYQDECKFIDGLGTHTIRPSNLNYAAQLRRYIENTAERTEVFAIRARQYAIMRLGRLR